MQTESTHQPPSSSSRWARIGALLYDPFLWVAELAGMRRGRRALLAQASGRVLEIGAGTGLNLAHYLDDEIDELVLAEPEPAMRERLTRRIRRCGSHAAVVDAPAEALPFADESFDTVVCTLVLCTVNAPDRALSEIGRVLRPDGRLLFIEHVRADSPTLAYLQDRLLEPWRRFASGCRCNRATVELMRACGFHVDARQSPWHAMPPIVRPLVSGRATCEAVIRG